MPTPTSAKLNPLIPFDMVIDTEIGLLKFIESSKYNNHDVFYDSILKGPIKSIIYLLKIRDYKNPLIIAMKDKEDKEAMDDYYIDFIDKEYISILNKSISTEVYNFISLCINTEGAITPIIFCKKEIEKKFLLNMNKDVFEKCEFIIADSYKDIDSLKSYDPIYLKNYTDAVEILDALEGKNIYVANYAYNFSKFVEEPDEKEQSILLENISLLLSDSNIIKITDVYNINSSFKAKG